MGIAQRSTAATAKQTTARRRKAKATLKSSTIAIYASIFALLVVIVGLGYHAPEQEASVANASTVNTYNTDSKASVNDVVATAIAADVATATNLSVAPNVTSLAVSAQIQSEIIQSDASSITKPQLVGADGQVRAVINYVAQKGDTMDSIASHFGISKQTIKWANNTTSDAVSVGAKLKIPPVDGVLYTVKSGDTTKSIAKKYGVDETRLILFNDLDLSGIKAGAQIILPSGTLPSNERPGYTSPVTTVYYGQGAGFGGRTWYIKTGTPMLSGNTYAHGNCTAYAYDRRVQLGLPVSAHWGNAATWAASAISQGLRVNRTPSVGAIMQNGGGLGHVAIVESILPNGDVSVSEMNAYVAGGGYNVVSGRIVLAANASQYLYIH